MKDELVTFETAKLANEKGFDEGCELFYTRDGLLKAVAYYDITPRNAHADTNEWFSSLNVGERIGATAPTQSLLQRWLREKYAIHIRIDSPIDAQSKDWHGDVFQVGKYSTMQNLEQGESYEEVLEAGLQEALKLITN